MNYLMNIEVVSDGGQGVLRAKYVTKGFEVRECTLSFSPNQKRYWASIDEGRKWRYATHLINRKEGRV